MTFPAPRCSIAGCHENASVKAAAAWTYGSFNELKTYGFACDHHADAIKALAEERLKPPFLAAGESLGPIQIYPFPARG